MGWRNKEERNQSRLSHATLSYHALSSALLYLWRHSNPLARLLPWHILGTPPSHCDGSISRSRDERSFRGAQSRTLVIALLDWLRRVSNPGFSWFCQLHQPSGFIQCDGRRIAFTITFNSTPESRSTRTSQERPLNPLHPASFRRFDHHQSCTYFRLGCLSKTCLKNKQN